MLHIDKKGISMKKDERYGRAENYIISQIEKMEHEVDEYQYSINSLELELSSICNKMVEVKNKGDKTQELFTSTNNNQFKAKEYSALKNRKSEIENLKENKVSELNKLINKISEMKKIINNSFETVEQNVDNNNQDSGKVESDSEILWILEEDRQRISRDIHDTVVQNLTALIHKEEFINQILDKDVNRARIEINNAKTLLKDSIKELRDIIYQLRPMGLDDLGFNEALLNLVDKLDDNYKDIIIHTTVDCSDEMSQIVCISSLRIINELSSNSYKYADCSNIYIDVSTDEEYIYIDYRDDGKGFDYNSIGKVKNNNSGYGIRMLNERVILLKGSIEYNREKAEFKIKLPLH